MSTGKSGLIIVYTGDGKGKTTAALGLCLRAIGNGMKTCVIQFIKGKWKTGESEVSKILGDGFEFYKMGRGFTWEGEKREEDKRLALEGWSLAKRKISDTGYDLIVLDELTYAVEYGFLKESDVLSALEEKPEKLHVVVTGRKAFQGLIDIADTVTEMKEIKHHYRKGLRAQRGIEF